MSKDLALQQSESEQRFSLSGLNLELDNFINITKDGIKHTANMAANSVLDGECDPLDALIFVKKGSELFKELDAKIRPIAEGKQIGVDFQKFGVKITEGMTGVKYDFSTCNDQEFEQLNEVFEAAKDALEERKNFLKSVTKPLELVNTDTGETYTINPPVKSGKMGFTLTIK